MINFAKLSLCRELYKITQWSDVPAEQWYGYEPASLILPANVGHTPCYSLGYLVDKALSTGLKSVKIKQADNGVVVTAPPCYHIEAKTPADAMAKLLIRSVKRGVVNA